jgi:hypothetical protein
LLRPQELLEVRMKDTQLGELMGLLPKIKETTRHSISEQILIFGIFQMGLMLIKIILKGYYSD